MDNVLSLVRKLQAPEAAIRQSAETELHGLGTANPNELVSGLMSIANAASVEIAARQMALSTLKLAVYRHWNIGFTNYVGPPVSPDTKQVIRQTLMGLIGDGERKVRTLAAQLLAKIASVEFPEEWPSLIDEVVQLIKQGTADQLQGALNVLNEILYDALSAEEFVSVGPAILPELYQIASSDQVNIASRTSAVECFKRCMLFFEQMSKPTEQVLQIGYQEVGKWFGLFAEVLQYNVDNPAQLGIIKLKMEIITAVKEIKEGLEEAVVSNSQVLVTAAWTDLKQSLEVYDQYYIKSDADIVGQTPEEREITDASFDSLKSQEFALVCEYMGNNNEALVSEMARIIPYYAQLTKPYQNECEDVTGFVTEETDLCMDDKVRYQVANAVCDRQHPQFIQSLWELLAHTDDWVLRESCLYLITQMLCSDRAMDKSLLNAHLLNELAQRALQSYQSSQYPRLQARALLLISAIVREDQLAAEVKTNFLQLVLIEAFNSPNAIVRVASLFTVKSFCEELKQQIYPHQDAIFNTILSLVPLADEDTPAFLVEVMQYAIRLDYNKAAQSSNIMQLLFTLASKDTANVELTSEASDVFEDIVEFATENGYYVQVCQNSMPTLMNGLGQMKDWEYSADVVLALGLMCELLRQGPTPLPDQVLEAVVLPLYRIIVNTSDVELAQAASEAFTHLVEHASEQLKTWQGNGQSGPDMILQVASKLLDPKADDSATLNSGKLILAIFQKFGSDLGNDVFKQLLEAVALRLTTAKNLVLVQNLVSVFCELVLQSPSELVNMLSSLQVGETRALDVVLEKWLGSFDVVRGYEAIKNNVIALQRLYELDDDRIKSVLVDGDVEDPEPGIIVTRSRAKNLKVTRIPAHVKIIKLLVNEMSTTPYDATNANQDAADYADDDDWEDEPVYHDPLQDLVDKFGGDASGAGNGTEERQVDSETFWTIINWFKGISANNTSDLRAIYQTQLNANEQKIVLDHANM